MHTEFVLLCYINQLFLMGLSFKQNCLYIIIQIMADQLTHILKQRIDFTHNTLYQNLTIYDTIIKQLQISPTHPIALSAYELICRQYINPKTPSQSQSQSSKGPSSPQNSNTFDINDPEVMGHFSFAKKPKHYFHIQKEVKPQRLFYDSKEDIENKSFSQKVRTKQIAPRNLKTYVSNFQLPLVDFDEQNISKDDWKQRSRIKFQDIESKEAEVTLMLKNKHFVQLIDMMRAEKKIIIRELRIKAAIFKHQSHIIRKSWRGFQEELKKGREYTVKVDQFTKIKEEIMVQQYFLAWKQRALMSQAQRNYEAEINKGYEKLVKIRFLKNLFKHFKNTESRKNQLNQKQMSLTIQIKQRKKKDILDLLAQNLFEKNDFSSKNNRLCLMIKKREAQLCLNIIKKLTIIESKRQQKLILRMQRYLYGFNLIKKMKLDYEISQVYWRNPQKIVFLKMIFEAISDSLSRKGYNQQWMRQLPICLANTDKKLNDFQQKYNLGKVFRSFKLYLQSERQKIEQVRSLLGRRVLKKLIGNYKIQMLKQKERCQVESLNEIIYHNKIVFGFELFSTKIDRLCKRKSLMVEQRLYENKIKRALFYLASNRRANRYYEQKIQVFNQKIQRNKLRDVFYGFKQITMTAIVNNRIVKEFTDYRNILKLTAIFACLKQYTIEEKIMRKRYANLTKLRVSSYFGMLTFNMRVSMYGRFKARHQQLKNKQKKFREQLQKKQCRMFFKLVKKQQLRKVICLKMDEEYNQRLKYKIFKILQTVNKVSKQQNNRIKIIKQNKDAKIKQKALKGLVNSFLMTLLFKNVAAIADRFIAQAFLTKLKVFSYQQNQPIPMKQIQDQQE